jgi:hypothetical protein
MIMQLVYRKQSVSKSSMVSQRAGLSQEPVFRHTKLLSALGRAVIQSTAPAKMLFKDGPGLL